MPPPTTALETVKLDATATLVPAAVNGLPINLPNGTRLDGVTLTNGGLPDQTGHSGHYLTTNGTAANWAALDLSLYQTKAGTLALGGFGSITGRVGNANLPLGAQLYDNAGTPLLSVDAAARQLVDSRGTIVLDWETDTIVTLNQAVHSYGVDIDIWDGPGLGDPTIELHADERSLFLNPLQVGVGAHAIFFDSVTGHILMGSFDAAINADSVTATRSYSLPDASGTFMLTSAIGSTVQAYDSGLGLVKPAVAVVATSNLTLSGEQTIDGQLTSGSLVLCTAQNTGANNGPWVSGSGAWTRPTWYSTGSTSQAPQFLTTFVRLGTTYTGSTWRMTTASVTIGTTATTWVQTPISLGTTNVTGTLAVANGGTGITSLGSGIATWLGTPTEANLKLAQSGIAWLDTAQTFTAAQINSVSGAASTPAMKYSGTPFAGTGTTSFPLFYINDSTATASTTLSTSGTYLGANGHGSADLMNLLLDGTSKLKVTSGGNVTAGGNITTGASGVLTAGSGEVDFGASALIYAPSSGVLRMSTLAGTSFTGLDFRSDNNSGFRIGFAAVNGIDLQSGAGTTTWNDSSTANSGTVANRYLFGIAAPTLTSTGTSVTNTVASTVYIGGAPTASTNTTIATPYALNVAAGVSNFAGPLVVAAAYTVATLPSTAATGKVTGAQATVTDGDASLAWGATVINSGAGATKYLVWYNGTNWTVLGK